MLAVLHAIEMWTSLEIFIFRKCTRFMPLNCTWGPMCLFNLFCIWSPYVIWDYKYLCEPDYVVTCNFTCDCNVTQFKNLHILGKGHMDCVFGMEMMDDGWFGGYRFQIWLWYCWSWRLLCASLFSLVCVLNLPDTYFNAFHFLFLFAVLQMFINWLSLT